MTDYLQELKDLAEQLHVDQFVAPVLCDDRFATWSGASKSHQHHYGTGGLLKHTFEVVMLSMKSAEFYIQMGDMTVDEQSKLLIAAVWHDYGKIWDYRCVCSVKDVWEGTEHRQRIRHLTRSAIEWEKFADAGFTEELGDGVTEEITHAILSHHGYFEGNTHKPQTKIATILHLSDNLSARVTDCINGRHDFK